MRIGKRADHSDICIPYPNYPVICGRLISLYTRSWPANVVLTGRGRFHDDSDADYVAGLALVSRFGMRERVVCSLETPTAKLSLCQRWWAGRFAHLLPPPHTNPI